MKRVLPVTMISGVNVGPLWHGWLNLELNLNAAGANDWPSFH